MTRLSKILCAVIQIATLLIIAQSTVRAQYSHTAVVDSAKIPQPSFHYQQEYTFDVSSNPAAWNRVSSGLHAAFVSTDDAYFRTEAPTVNEKNTTWNESGWRGEKLNAMILTWSADTISQVRFVTQDLRSTKGEIIPARNIRLDMVRYVISNYPYDAKEVTCGVGPTDKAYLMPDRFESFDRFEIPGRTVRPVWLSVDIPSSISPGLYFGKIRVLSDKQELTLTLALQVQNQLLPPPKDWSFRLDLWQNPWVLAEYYKVKPWSAEHVSLLKEHLKHYANAGGKYITTYAVHSPWADNSYMIEGNMIGWTRTRMGVWKFDYTIFDTYVQLAIDAGIDKAITLYTPIPWGERFRFMDEATGNYVTERWLPVSSAFRKNWHLFLSDLSAHLQRKGWLDKFYLGINENAMEQTLAAIKVIKDHSPNWKITYAGDWHPELDGLLDDYSCVFGKEPPTQNVMLRRLKKKTTSYYVCCTPAKPNTFVFSPPVEGRWLGWYTSAYGYDGFLRWAYEAWPADPVRDARHVLWPAGDCFRVYPGGASCVRFEKMREGIVDFEKLRILRAKIGRSSDPSVKPLAFQLDQLLKNISTSKDLTIDKLKGDIQQGRKLIDELSVKLK